jgi:hypothetical protein
MITRAQIIQVLEGELNVVEDREATDENAAFRQVLVHLIAGFQALEGGEVRPLFVPKKVKAKGKWPATLRKCRLMAIGAVRALRKAGYKAKDAIQIVAGAYGVTEDAVRQWQKTLGKDTDIEAQMTMSLLPSSYSLFLGTKEGLLEAVTKAGQSFKEAQEKKGK